MVDTSTISEHLIQAALRNMERGDVNGLQAILREHPAIVRWRGTGDGQGLIHAAAKVGHVDMLSVLLDAGADPNMPEGERIDDEDGTVYQPGYVPLHYAAWKGHERAVKLLLARGALATATDYVGGTALHAAKNVQIADALLKAGADPNANCSMRYFDETLGWHFAGRPLHAAGEHGNGALIRVLVGHGADVDGHDCFTRRAALHYAAARGSAEAVEALLELGADPDARSEEANYGGTSRMTPLHYAAREGHEAVVRALLKAGANPRLLGGMHDETAGKLALQQGHRGIAAMLAAATTIARVNTTTKSSKEAERHPADDVKVGFAGLDALFGRKGTPGMVAVLNEEKPMTESLIEPLDEAKRWRSRDVKYWAGTWEAISSLIPKFEISDFRAEAGSPANPYMRTVVRLPKTLLEQRIPVGVVSNTYTLAQHHAVAEQCFEGILQAGVNPVNLPCEVGLTDLGEWMNLRIYLPDDRDFKPAKGDAMKLRLECYNSVDGSCRVVVLLGWLRLICTNGLVISKTKTELNDLHNAQLDLARIPKIVCKIIKEVRNDVARMTLWRDTAVRADNFAPWANKYVSDDWGKKAACRVFHICNSGHDVEFDGPFAPGKACDKPVHQTVRVPGSPVKAANLFDVCQAMSWVATGRNNPDQRLEWQLSVPRLVGQLGQMVSR